MMAFAVEDKGVGIPKDQQQRVLERFESRSQGSKHRGAGLGLSIVKSLVELHGGAMSLESEPGRGTRVTVRFPESGMRQPGAGTRRPTVHERRRGRASSMRPASSGWPSCWRSRLRVGDVVALQRRPGRRQDHAGARPDPRAAGRRGGRGAEPDLLAAPGLCDAAADRRAFRLLSPGAARRGRRAGLRRGAARPAR